MIQMSFDEYDKKLEIFEKIKDSEQLEPCWPTLKQVDRFYDEPEKFIIYALYLYEMNPEPTTKEEEYSKKNLNCFINDNFELI